MIDNINGTARTAWYCCGVRWADAQKKAPICGDHFAEIFMDEEARALFEPFASLRMPNATSVTRTRIIDDWLRDRLLADPEQLVVILGAGFDARAFRLPGGRWAEMKSTLSALSWAFPRHTLMIDLMSRRFAGSFGGKIRQRLAAIGGHFATDMPDDPRRTILAQRYRQIARVSMAWRARELSAAPIPVFLLDTLLRPLRDGYCAHVFDAGGT